MLYEALAGQKPFSGTVADIILAKLTRRPMDLRRVPGLPSDLADLAMALLELDPSQRPQGRDILQRLRGEGARTSSGPDLRIPKRSAVGRGAARAFAEAYETVVREIRRSACVGCQGGKAQWLRTLTTFEAESRTVLLRGRCYEQESVPTRHWIIW
jgi:serine/threonine protein kinase